MLLNVKDAKCKVIRKKLNTTMKEARNLLLDKQRALGTVINS